MINLPSKEYLPSWFRLAGEYGDEDEDDEDMEISEKDTVKREADGVISGEGEAKESLLDQSCTARHPGGPLTGVG